MGRIGFRSRRYCAPKLGSGETAESKRLREIFWPDPSRSRPAGPRRRRSTRNVREALRIAREARTILGASGITLEYPVIRHANNLESVLTYEGTSEIRTLAIGQALTGHAAYR